jgi:hypothetical protein
MTCQATTQPSDAGRAQPEQEPTRTKVRRAHISTTHADTGSAANMLLVQPQTLLKSHSQNGCYGAIRPVRLPSGKLGWPLAEIEKVLRALGANEPTEDP